MPNSPGVPSGGPVRGRGRLLPVSSNRKTPYLTLGEAMVAAAWRAAGRSSVKPPDGSCPFLGPDGKCRIYDGRPFGYWTHFCEAAGGARWRAASCAT